jgi:hypothetical protein
MTDTTPMVRERAYAHWEKAGRPNGREHEFWALASAEIEGEPQLFHKNAHGAPVPARTSEDGSPQA